MFAKKLGRRYVGIELNPDYVKMAQARLDEVSYQAQLIAAE
jgi:DNA modification methylase